MHGNYGIFVDLIKSHIDRNLRRVHDLQESQTVPIASWMCSFMPMELIEAAGFAGYRMLEGGDELDEIKGARWMKSESCSFCKACLGSFPSKTYPRPDVLIVASPCDQMRRTAELFSREHGVKCFIIHTPRTVNKESSQNYFRDELTRLTDELSLISGIKNWHERLPAIVQHRQKLLVRIANVRKSLNLKTELSGREFILLDLAVSQMGNDALDMMVTELEKYLIELPPESCNSKLKIMILGSVFTEHDLKLMNLFSNDNVQILSTEFCTGIRQIPGNYYSCNDPIDFLVEFYWSLSTCTALHPNDNLYNHLHQVISENEIDAAVMVALKFCHPWNSEIVHMREELGIPILFLDRDYSASNEGQWKTRYNAFIESLLLSKNRKVM